MSFTLFGVVAMAVIYATTVTAKPLVETQFTRPSFPMDSSVRIVVPCPIGSPGDILARRIARDLSERSGRHFHVENLDAEAAGRAQSDENTMLFGPANPADTSSCGE
jgi:tripartite-type tricarboxylate transporter receptor subunit TctC